MDSRHQGVYVSGGSLSCPPHLTRDHRGPDEGYPLAWGLEREGGRMESGHRLFQTCPLHHSFLLSAPPPRQTAGAPFPGLVLVPRLSLNLKSFAFIQEKELHLGPQNLWMPLSPFCEQTLLLWYLRSDAAARQLSAEDPRLSLFPRVKCSLGAGSAPHPPSSQASVSGIVWLCRDMVSTLAASSEFSLHQSQCHDAVMVILRVPLSASVSFGCRTDTPSISEAHNSCLFLGHVL